MLEILQNILRYTADIQSVTFKKNVLSFKGKELMNASLYECFIALILTYLEVEVQCFILKTVQSQGLMLHCLTVLLCSAVLKDLIL